MRISPGRSAPVRAACASSSRGYLALADLRAGQAPGHRHPVRGRDQVQLQSPVPARMRCAVSVVQPTRPARIAGLFPARSPHGTGVASISRTWSCHDGAVAGQVVHRRGQQRRGCLEPLVIARLVRQVREQVPQPGVAQPQPVVLRPGAQQHLRYRQAHQFRVGELLRPARPAPGRKESRDRRSARTVPSGGLPGLQSRATMDALLPFPDQPDTPQRSELGIIHPGEKPRPSRPRSTADGVRPPVPRSAPRRVRQVCGDRRCPAPDQPHVGAASEHPDHDRDSAGQRDAAANMPPDSGWPGPDSARPNGLPSASTKLITWLLALWVSTSRMTAGTVISTHRAGTRA